MESVSLVLNLYNPYNEQLSKLGYSLIKQKTKRNIEAVLVDKDVSSDLLNYFIKILRKSKNIHIKIIKANPSISFAASMNIGIKVCSNKFVIILQQDCIPSKNNWLEKLILPLERGYIASVSDVELPESLWNKFDAVSKILSIKERRVITPLLDEKACSYKKDMLEKVDFFDEKNFKTAGEDFDMYTKLSQLGKIAYPHTKITHHHSYNWKSRLKKEYQLSNGFGALVRIYGRKMPRWYAGFIKAIPIIGYPLFFKGIKPKELGLLSLVALPLLLLVNFIYSYGFWKGFFNGRQTV